MNTLTLTPFLHRQPHVYWVGIALCLLSVFVLLVAPGVNGDATFLLHFGLTACVAIGYLASRKRISKHRRMHLKHIISVLMLISAWSLNATIPIFDTPVWWMVVLQAVFCVALLAGAFWGYLGRLALHVLALLLGMGIPLFLYLAIYLLPGYVIGALGSFLFGISLHIFVPLFLSVAGVRLITRLYRRDRKILYTALVGLAFALLSTLVFVWQWSASVQDVNRAYRSGMDARVSGLPAWVSVAAAVPDNTLSRKVLESALVYNLEGSWGRGFLDFPTSGRMGDERLHDPWITVANMFSSPAAMEPHDRIKVLESMYNRRAEGEERLWSGDNLSTEWVETKIDLWPQYRMALVESRLTVRNNRSDRNWNRQGEAIYTFSLPEGAVVSALSLWVNGVEEEAALTTKEKATTAYNTIVGREVRDPSVVHWREGNTVAVRVFPVMEGEVRHFKLGVTVPLSHGGGTDALHAIRFVGPAYGRAKEKIKVVLKGSLPDDPTVPTHWKSEGSGVWNYEGVYKKDWTLYYKAPPLQPATFVFNGHAYRLKDYKAPLDAFSATDLYVDLHRGWGLEDFTAVCDAAGSRPVWVWQEGWTTVTLDNRRTLYDALSGSAFSLFPFHLLPRPASALVVTRRTEYAPNLDDLKGSRYAEGLRKFLAGGQSVALFSLDELSPYLRTLHEYRALRLGLGSTSDLRRYLTENIFPHAAETDSSAVVHTAGLELLKTRGTGSSGAPDALMRLYAYNHIMREMRNTPDSAHIDDSPLILLAKEAHIVTPLSSMVVLETQKDYDRFDIQKSKDSLGNAKVGNAGAVPEPHEWVLILLGGALLMVYLRRTKKMAV